MKKVSPKWALPLRLLVLMLGYGLPLTIAAFPQTGRIQTRQLEPHFQQATMEPVLIYNKGL